MGDIVDVRPDRFLREMREHGEVNKACTNSGLALADLEALCIANRKFDISQVECYLEHLEDTLLAETRKLLAGARARAYSGLEVRHGSG